MSVKIPFKRGADPFEVARVNAAYGNGYNSGYNSGYDSGLNKNIQDVLTEKSTNILSKIGGKSADFLKNNIEGSDKLAEIMGDNAALTGGLVSAGALGAGVLAGNAIKKLKRSIRRARAKRSKERLLKNKAKLSNAISELRDTRYENKKLSKDLAKLTKGLRH